MNWNGGALSRSRNAITSLSAVQKGHFAKARGKLQKGRQSLYDLDFSTLSHATTEKRRLTPQSLAQPSFSPLHNGSHTALSPLNKKFKPGPVLLSSSPTLKDNPTGAEHHVAEVNLSAEDRLEAQKRELLTMRDWCGLKSTRPPSVVFPVISDVDQIGKRRPFCQEHHNRHTRQGVKRQRSGLSLAHESKKRKVQADHLCGMRNIEDENSLKTSPVQTAEAATDSDQMEFPTVASKNSSSNLNSDENLFDYEIFDHRPSQRVPLSRMSLSSQNSLPLRPSTRGNLLTARDMVYSESNKKLGSMRKSSSQRSQNWFEENSDGGFSRESPHLGNSTFNFCSTFGNEIDSHSSKPSHNRTLLAQSSTNSESIEDVRTSSVPYGHCVHVDPEHLSFETEVQPTVALKVHPAGGSTTERASPLKEKEPEVSPFGIATLSYLNALQTQSVVQTPDRASDSNEEQYVKEKTGPSPILQDTTLAKNESSPLLEARWRNFVLGVDDSNDDPDFVSKASPELRGQEESSSMNAELPFCSPSTDELQRPSGPPTVIFRKPPRFSGGQISQSGGKEGSHSSSPVSKWGQLRRQSKRAIIAEEDGIED